MRVSLNEIQTAIFKACIAVGLPVGISQDASHTARHIFPKYIGSMQPFVDAIFEVDNNSSKPFNMPDALKGVFRSATTDTNLSCLYAAPTVCDQILIRNKNTQSRSSIKLIDLDIPAVVVFEIMFITGFINNNVRIIWQVDQGNKMHGVCSNGTLTFSHGNYNDFLSLKNATLSLYIPNYISSLKNSYSDKLDLLQNLNIENKTWKCLSECADRLLIPSSDMSRLTGAGAGTIDAD